MAAMNHELSRTTAVGLVLVVGLFLFFPLLSASALWDPWEPKYAQTARELTDSGDWLRPTYRGYPRLVKPPLTYWMVAVSQAVFGVREVAARLPSALMAVAGAVALAWAFATRGRALTGAFAGLALLTSPQWLLLGRFATPDPVFAGWLAIGLALLLLPPGRNVALPFAIVTGLATLTEWPRGVLLPAWGVLAWSALGGGRRGVVTFVVACALYGVGQHGEIPALSLLSYGVAIAAAASCLVREAGVPGRTVAVVFGLVALLALPWIVFTGVDDIAEAADGVLGFKHGINLGETPNAHDGPFWFILLWVAAGAAPWFLLSAAGLARCRSDPAARLCAGAFLGFLAFFLASEAQMGHFYGVLQPSLACLAAIGVTAPGSRPRRLIPWVVAGAALLLWMARTGNDPSLFLETATVKASLFSHFDPFLPFVAALAVWSLVTATAVALGRPRWALLAAVPAGVFGAWLAMVVVPGLAPLKSAGPMYDVYEADRGESDPLASFSTGLHTTYYYSANAIERLRSLDELRRYLARPGRKYLIVTDSAHRGFPAADLPPGDVLDERHPSHRLVRFDAGLTPGRAR